MPEIKLEIGQEVILVFFHKKLNNDINLIFKCQVEEIEIMNTSGDLNKPIPEVFYSLKYVCCLNDPKWDKENSGNFVTRFRTSNKCIDSENQGKFIYPFWCCPVFTTKSKYIEWVNQ